jgi:hypothetical protein
MSSLRSEALRTASTYIQLMGVNAADHRISCDQGRMSEKETFGTTVRDVG